jgi:DNA-binding PadR family transcriptional regulator
MCDEDMNVRVLKYKLARFAGLDVPEITEILRQLTDKGFIKELEEDTDGADTSIAYRLIAS